MEKSPIGMYQCSPSNLGIEVWGSHVSWRFISISLSSQGILLLDLRWLSSQTYLAGRSLSILRVHVVGPRCPPINYFSTGRNTMDTDSRRKQRICMYQPLSVTQIPSSRTPVCVFGGTCGLLCPATQESIFHRWGNGLVPILYRFWSCGMFNRG